MSIAEDNFDRLENPEELYDAIEMGLDIEFRLYAKRYNISWRYLKFTSIEDKNKPFICICPDGDAKFYNSVEDLLNRHEVDGKPLRDTWKDMQILAM